MPVQHDPVLLATYEHQRGEHALPDNASELKYALSARMSQYGSKATNPTITFNRSQGFFQFSVIISSVRAPALTNAVNAVCTPMGYIARLSDQDSGHKYFIITKLTH